MNLADKGSEIPTGKYYRFLMYDEDEPVSLYIRIVLISIGPRLREFPRIPVPRTWVNRPSLEMRWFTLDAIIFSQEKP